MLYNMYYMVPYPERIQGCSTEGRGSTNVRHHEGDRKSTGAGDMGNG